MFIDYCQQLVGYYSIKLYGSVIYGFVITAVNYLHQLRSMELLSSRRLRLVSVQLSIKFGYCPA